MRQDALNYADLRVLARRRLPRGIFEYIDRGSEDEIALAANRTAWDAVKLVPSVLVDVAKRSQEIELFGDRQATPVVIAPTALAGLVWHDGEIALARAAANAGIPFCAATQSITAIGQIAAKTTANLWFQLYVWRDRALSDQLVDRAKAAGAKVLVLTVDTAIAPKREYNTRNGFGMPMQPSLSVIADMLVHPRWLCGVLLREILHRGVPSYANYPDEFKTRVTRAAMSQRVALADDLGWDDVKRLRRRWNGPLVVKGVMRKEDAEQAVASGADGIIVSNHGGRNLDSAPATANTLPEIADAVGNRLTVMADSGIRRGSDVVKALALGAKAVLVGRFALFGTAVGGEVGANHALALIRDEIDRTLALVGVPDIATIGREHIHIPGAKA